MIAVVDYERGNLRSVQKALEHVGAQAVVTRDPERIKNADKLVFPGVGAFADCMSNLQRFHLAKFNGRPQRFYFPLPPQAPRRQLSLRPSGIYRWRNYPLAKRFLQGEILAELEESMKEAFIMMTMEGY